MQHTELLQSAAPFSSPTYSTECQSWLNFYKLVTPALTEPATDDTLLPEYNISSISQWMNESINQSRFLKVALVVKTLLGPLENVR